MRTLRLNGSPACSSGLSKQQPPGMVNTVGKKYERMRARVYVGLLLCLLSPLAEGAAGGGTQVKCLGTHVQDYGQLLTKPNRTALTSTGQCGKGVCAVGMQHTRIEAS